ncbi:MAG: cob(I)yrinic acid a,c-diamide adenosyltransferase [Gallionellales bacterium RIFCSPLOWO2_12_FULL_59_22]|nr:MAG: cob(I)yrinic acid a,c-diamide adenosyltransferase [Gallionellales bacterium RIFCSPLOWO2_02_FULL_59_110]OGT13141.1 MAG: cob(I)yrinic acid a,c-diamide adenosyltransferase [Gallionellales bacterium RIFCSPLOWO2_12_FULL_59_22]
MTEKTEAAAERHRARKQHHKEIVDARISAATQQRGVILVHTGNGKGKSSAAFGMVARSLGHGMRVGVVQFIKGGLATGEETFFRRFPEVEYHVMGEGYTWETQDRERDIAKAQAAWQVAHDMLRNPALQLVVLDEINIALKLGYLDPGPLLEALNNRPAMQHVILTGRGAPDVLIEIADTVTEMRPLKHAFDAGIQAQEGVEF